MKHTCDLSSQVKALHEHESDFSFIGRILAAYGGENNIYFTRKSEKNREKSEITQNVYFFYPLNHLAIPQMFGTNVYGILNS